MKKLPYFPTEATRERTTYEVRTALTGFVIIRQEEQSIYVTEKSWRELQKVVNQAFKKA